MHSCGIESCTFFFSCELLLCTSLFNARELFVRSPIFITLNSGIQIQYLLGDL